MLDEVIDRFNEAARALQTTEFRRPSTPDEWQQGLARNPAAQDYKKLFQAVVPILNTFAAANASDRASAASKLNPDALSALQIFAYSMPVLAVRRQSPELIAQGLTALAILGTVDDVRDLTYCLCTLHFSAMKLGIDAQKLFGDIASLVPSAHLQNEMRGFPVRPPKDRDLAAFYYRETSTDEGFNLVQEFPDHR